MGLFDLFKKNKNRNEQNIHQSNPATLGNNGNPIDVDFEKMGINFSKENSINFQKGDVYNFTPRDEGDLLRDDLAIVGLGAATQIASRVYSNRSKRNQNNGSTAQSESRIMIGLGWDIATNKNITGDYDLDVAVLMLGPDDKYSNPDDFIYYNHLKHSSKSVIHMGDNLVGGGKGDSEVVLIELDKIPSNIARLKFIVSIYRGEERKQSFGEVQNAYIRLADIDSSEELLRYNLTGVFPDSTSVVFAEIFRTQHGWSFSAIGEGHRAPLFTLTKKHLSKK